MKRIQGYGLPFPKDPSRKGDLLVAFDIQFPEKLTAAQKELLRDMLWCVCGVCNITSKDNTNAPPYHDDAYNYVQTKVKTLCFTKCFCFV